MPILATQLDTRDADFQARRQQMLGAIDTLQALQAEAAEGGGTETLARLRKRGKLPLRERIAGVLDRDTAFLEISPLAAYASDYAMGIASQKNFVAVYHMGIYADKKLMDWFVDEYPNHVTTKLDMGKSCIRFKKPEQIPFELIGELASKMSVADWVATYERAFRR